MMAHGISSRILRCLLVFLYFSSCSINPKIISISLPPSIQTLFLFLFLQNYFYFSSCYFYFSSCSINPKNWIVTGARVDDAGAKTPTCKSDAGESGQGEEDSVFRVSGCMRKSGEYRNLSPDLLIHNSALNPKPETRRTPKTDTMYEEGKGVPRFQQLR
jgi:hypothetical protein